MNDHLRMYRSQGGMYGLGCESVRDDACSLEGTGKSRRGRSGRGRLRGRPRVLAIVDHPGWAHDFKTRQLARNLSDEFVIHAVFQEAVTSRDLADADLVMAYYWMQIQDVHNVLPELDRLRSRLLIGICSHFELDGERRTPGIGMLNRTAGAVFANNLYLYREFRPLLSPPLFYTPNGVDTAFFRPALPGAKHPDRPFHVGWAGSLTNVGRKHRGFDEFIVPAVASVQGAVLVTAVREDRWRSRAEMRKFYHSLDACVCASETEGTPNPCLEASACGVPVITTAVGNMPEFIRDGQNGFIVSRDVQSIADRLRTLAGDQPLRASMSRQARLAAESWGWHLQAGRYRRMFRFCLVRAAELPEGTADMTLDPKAAFARQVSRMLRTGALPWVWGSGAGGQRVAVALNDWGIPWRGFIDSDTRRCGTLVAGRPVVSPEVLAGSEPATVIVASSFAIEICARLVESGHIEGQDFLVAPLDALAIRS
jgi:glycosyltransferase involved in cell wall biosynthesis